MPDLTIGYYSQCKTNSFQEAEVGGYTQILGGERRWPTCTCSAYKYRRNGTTNFGGKSVPNPCKHIKQAEELACGWHEAYSSENQTEKNVCPKCGGETEIVQVAE